MTELANPDRLLVAQRFLTHVRSNDTEKAIESLAENVNYHVLGNHALSGTFVGPQAVVKHFVEMADRIAGGFDLVKWQDLMLGVQHVAVLVEAHMEAKNRSFVGQLLIVMKFDSHEKIDRVTVFFEDIDAAERFYGRR